MKSNLLRWCCGCLLLGCVIVFVGAWQWRAREAMRAWDPDRARSANEPIPVRTVKVDECEMQETIGGTAVTLPVQSAIITIPLSSSAVADRCVKQVGFQPGAAVKHGEMLFEFEPLLFEQSLKQRDAVLAKS